MTSVATDCPSCGSKVPAGSGLSQCPSCHSSLSPSAQVAMSAIPTSDVHGMALESTGPPRGPDFEKRYAIDSELGAGAMGTVYLARQIALDREVAIKCVRGLTGGMARRLVQEGRSLAKLIHAHIAMIFDAGEAGGLPFLVFEYVKGESLRHLLIREKAIPFEKALTLSEHLLDGMGYAHDQGIIHRDIKPENLLVSIDGNLKIADFGLAQVVQDSVPAAGMTAAGQIIGTPEYMSPERISGEPSTPSADIYAAGLVIYEMVAGRRPFDSRGLQALVDHGNWMKKAPDPREYRPEIPEELARTVLWSVEKDPAARPARAADLRARLARCRFVEAAPARTTQPPRTATTPTINFPPPDAFVTALTKAVASAPPPAAATVSVSRTSVMGTAPQIPGLTARGPNRKGHLEYEDPTDGTVLVLVGEGEFDMGSPSGAPDEAPAHRTALPAYLIGKHPVTNRQYHAFCKATGHPGPANGFDPSRTLWFDGEPTPEILDQPIVNVSHPDALAYVAWAGKQLPSEAQWEKAARGMTQGPYPWGPTEPGAARALFNRAWMGRSTLLPVGRLPEGESPLGVAEMAGSVWEWTADWYAPDTYTRHAHRGPTGPESGERRVVRGGAWSEPSWYLRVTCRLGFYPDGAYDIVGFRVVRALG